MAVAIDYFVHHGGNELADRIRKDDENLRRLVIMGLNIYGHGSELEDVDLFLLINEQISRNSSHGRMLHKAMMQTAQIRTHQFYLSERNGHVTPDEAAQSWIEFGYAKRFSDEYNRIYGSYIEG